MENLLGNSGRYKAKNKKPSPKSKNAKKKKTESGPTCSMFLAELTRKLASKRREEQNKQVEEEPEEAPKNIIHTIISSLTNALPVVLSKKSPDRLAPVQVETLAPELIPNDTLEVLVLPPQDDAMEIDEPLPQSPQKKNQGYRMPKMPLTSSDVMKPPAKREPVVMEDVGVNTGNERDVAAELVKHVGTLKKISLIAEQFNQKTAKNLKEIVDSVQGDLVKKLEEIQAEQKAAEQSNAIATKLMHDVEGSVQG